MRDSNRPPNVVTAARTGRRRTSDPHRRRRIFGGLFLIAAAAIATIAFASDRHVREWAAGVAAVSVLLIVVAWLAGASRALTSSGRDPSDFSGSADSL